MTAGGEIGGSVPIDPSVGGYPSSMVAARHVVITGLMGAGKSSVGRRVAGRLGCAWHDSDIDIEAETGATVRELRDHEGVDAMHAREWAHLLDALAAPETSVISAAASVIDDARCRAALEAPGVALVWLRAAADLLATRFASKDDHRPVYGESITAFLADQATRREPLAIGIGAHVVEIGFLSEEDVVARVVAALG
jgi:shikimate kinase